jgi:hypothetical protein
MTDEDRSASHAMTVMMIALAGGAATIDLLVPADEHVAITLTLREWIALVGTMEASFKAMQQLPKVADDPLFQKALAAFRVLEAKLSIANEAASARRMSEGNHP